MKYRKATFVLHAAPNLGSYIGWTDGSLWNGFATPLFDRKTLVRIARDCNDAFSVDTSSGLVVIAHDGYDEVKDDPEPDIFMPRSLRGIPVDVYDLSGWTFVEDDQEN